MPLYDYHCKTCGATFEMNRKISERDETGSVACPECATTGQIERGVSAPLVAYSIATSGYGRNIGGFKDVLTKIHERAPGSQLNKTSSFL